MLQKIAPNTIYSDEGFKIRFDHHYAEYTLSDNQLVRIELEWLASPHGVVFYFSTMPKFWSIPSNLAISSEESVQIKSRICQAAKFLGIDYEMD